MKLIPTLGNLKEAKRIGPETVRNQVRHTAVQLCRDGYEHGWKGESDMINSAETEQPARKRTSYIHSFYKLNGNGHLMQWKKLDEKAARVCGRMLGWSNKAKRVVRHLTQVCKVRQELDFKDLECHNMEFEFYLFSKEHHQRCFHFSLARLCLVKSQFRKMTSPRLQVG